MISGFLLLNKPQGVTSQQAIYHLRKKLTIPKTIKIGHGGTLDPLATGMLVIALGSATKFLGYLLNANKTYSVTAKLGQVTTTLDAEGEIISESIVPDFKEQDLKKILVQFTGPIEQIPPMYSALKFQGKPLYHYARQGQEIIRPARSVHIYQLRLQNRDKNNFSFVSQVSKGTYIRSLVHDIGQVLGCGAHVQALHREQVDPFQADDMIPLEQMSEQHIRPIDSLFMDLPPLMANLTEIKKLKSGHILTRVNTTGQPALLALRHDLDNQFFALVKIDEQGQIKGEKWV